MVWGILQLIFAAVCCFVAGAISEEGDKKSLKWLLTNLLAAILLSAAGVYDICNYSAGRVSFARFQDSESIYIVDGEVQTSRGTIVAVENGSQDVLVLWNDYEDSPGHLPSEAKFARITKDEKGKWRLEPVAAP